VTETIFNFNFVIEISFHNSTDQKSKILIKINCQSDEMSICSPQEKERKRERDRWEGGSESLSFEKNP
jgi:hypothetical protein